MTMDSGDPESPDLFFLAAIFWVTLVTLGLMPMVIETVRFGREHAERQGFGMSLFIILIMSIPAAAAPSATEP